MRFPWQEQQLLVRSMLHRYVDDRRGSATVSSGFDRASWKELAELGVLGLPFAEEDGGMAGTALDTLIVGEAFGRGLVRLPYISTVVLGGGVLRLAGSDAQKAAHLPALIAGDRLLALAFAEAQSRYNPADVATRAVPFGDGFRLDGTKIAVLGAPEADVLLVTARTGGGQRDEEGVSLFLVPRDRLALRPCRTIDGQTAAEVTLAAVQVPADALVGEPGGAGRVLERVLDEAAMAICADAVGAMGALNDRCLEFTQTRKAFGQPIAQFQAIQHRLVDMRVSYEIAAAITLKAATHLADGIGDAARAVSACKVQVNEEAGFVGKTAVQMHGAIGITEELDIGHYFKRLTAMQLAFGSSDHHLRRCIRADRTRNTPEVKHGH